ncbi:hypothetical protein [uncultured Sphingobium sp.]|uniref:hypothetical protein n=1 Tax=uncultured Sphingobium sp. TaxID=316087 RepID=UPI00259BEDB2|nr:hypothetical protein [uncultured Sphingobium sp.]
MNFTTAPRMRDPALSAWTVLRFAKAPIRLSEIIFANDSDANPRPTLADTIILLDRWRGAGLIAWGDKPETYTMLQEAKALRDPPALAAPSREPTPRSTRQRIWSAIRVMKSFDLVELCFTATVERGAASRVLNQLTRAGYLIRTERRGDDHPRWRVVRRSGPNHPRVEYAGRTVVALIDRNSGQRFPLSPIQNFLAREVNHGQ